MRARRSKTRSSNKPSAVRPRSCRGAERRTRQREFSSAEDQEELQKELLAQITHGGRLCAEVERHLGQNPAPELETLIKLYRVLILKFSLEANVAPQLFQLVCHLMKPVMDWARLQEKRKERELAEQKYRDGVQKEARACEAKDEEGLSPDTVQKIQRELKLF